MIIESIAGYISLGWNLWCLVSAESTLFQAIFKFLNQLYIYIYHQLNKRKNKKENFNDGLRNNSLALTQNHRQMNLK